MDTKKKAKARKRIKSRVRGRVQGTSERPRLTVFRSNKQIYAQVIDDLAGRTLASASSHLARTAPKVPSLTRPLRWESRLQRRPKLQECLKWSLTATDTSTMAAFKNLLKLPAKVA